jgi:hypothetical protein
MTSLDTVAADNDKIIQGFRPLTSADVDSIHGMGLSAGQWRDILAHEKLRSYLRVNDATKQVYFLGYVAAQFAGDECVHISIAVGEKDNIDIREGQTKSDRPTVYNATREIGLLLADTLSKAVHEKIHVDLAALCCLTRLIPGIPNGDGEEDKGLHMSLFNKAPNGSAPAAADVRELQKKFENGVAIQLDLANFKIIKGSRCNDMRTGGLHYLACGMSQDLATLCSLIKERFSDAIKGYAPHVSLELWGVAGCRHAQQRLGEGADLKYWYCDYLRWGIEAGVFEKCLDAQGKFDIARYMYVRTHSAVGSLNDAEKANVGETLVLMNHFSLDAVDKFIEMVDGYKAFGCVSEQQRLHDKDSTVYTFFANAPAHAGVDDATSRIKNCATAAGEGPRWYPGTEVRLPATHVQERIQKYISSRDAAKSSGGYACLL